jgi:hypothetical protein
LALQDCPASNWGSKSGWFGRSKNSARNCSVASVMCVSLISETSKFHQTGTGKSVAPQISGRRCTVRSDPIVTESTDQPSAFESEQTPGRRTIKRGTGQDRKRGSLLCQFLLEQGRLSLSEQFLCNGHRREQRPIIHVSIVRARSVRIRRFGMHTVC